MSTLLFCRECNLIILTQLYAQHILSNLFFLDIKKFKFKHNHCARAKQINMYSYLIHVCRTEFVKINPINV